MPADELPERSLTDIECEEHILASLILDPSKVAPMVANTLTRADFTDPNIGAAVDACVLLHNAGKPTNDLTLLERQLSAMAEGWTMPSTRLMRIVGSLPHAHHAGMYADRVRLLSRLRTFFLTTSALSKQAFQKGADPDDLIATLESKVLAMRHGSGQNARTIGGVWDEVIDDFQKQVGSGNRRVLLSGLPAVDDMGFVFAPGELSILAARPRIGKTALSTQIAMHHAKHGRTVLIASLEMKDTALASRLLLPAAGLNHHWLRTGNLDQATVDGLRTTRQELGDYPLYVWSPGRVKAGVIHATAAVLKATNDLQLLVVDYLGLVKPDDTKQQRYEQVGEIVKSLRGIAQHLDIPVLALCQLNREADKERPRLSNLRESGDIEQDADIVAFLHRINETQVELIVEKNRQGGEGTRTLRWHPEQTRFDDESTGRTWTPETSGHEANAEWGEWDDN